MLIPIQGKKQDENPNEMEKKIKKVSILIASSIHFLQREMRSRGLIVTIFRYMEGGARCSKNSFKFIH